MKICLSLGNRVRKDPEYDAIFIQLKKEILMFAKIEMTKLETKE